MFRMFPGLPEDERNELWHLDGSLRQLDLYINNFRAAIQLYDFCAANSRQVPSEWLSMAGRDGAMTLYHFDAVMEGIASSMDKLPTIKTLVDHKALRIARKLYGSFFPNFENMRHAVAHHCELRRDRKSTERNSRSGSYEGPAIKIGEGAKFITLVDCFQGRTFTTTHENQVLTYELSVKSLEKLHRIRQRFTAAFQALQMGSPPVPPASPREGQTGRQST